jgi:hypothetical protein
MAKPTPAAMSAPAPPSDASRSRLVVWLGTLQVGDRLFKRGDEMDTATEAELMQCRNWRAMISSGKLRRVEPEEWARLHRPKVRVDMKPVPVPVVVPDALIQRCVAEMVRLRAAGFGWRDAGDRVDSSILLRAMGEYAGLYGDRHRRVVDNFWDHIRELAERPKPGGGVPKPPGPPPERPRPAA